MLGTVLALIERVGHDCGEDCHHREYSRAVGSPIGRQSGSSPARRRALASMLRSWICGTIRCRTSRSRCHPCLRRRATRCPALGREVGGVRWFHLHHGRVQPRHLRRAQERLGLRPRTVRAQACGIGGLRERGRRACDRTIAAQHRGTADCAAKSRRPYRHGGVHRHVGETQLPQATRPSGP